MPGGAANARSAGGGGMFGGAAKRARGSVCKRRPLHLGAGEESEVEDCRDEARPAAPLQLCGLAHSHS